MSIYCILENISRMIACSIVIQFKDGQIMAIGKDGIDNASVSDVHNYSPSLTLLL